MATDRATQRDQARAQADTVRRYRQWLHRRLRDGGDHLAARTILADVLHGGAPGELHTMHLVMLLRWVPYLPTATAERIVAALGASPVVRVGQLTERQLSLLAILLRGDLLPALERLEDGPGG